MRELTGPGGLPNSTLLTIVELAVAGFVIGTIALYVKGHQWAREASLVPALAAEVQRHELVLKSVLLESYQWNQSHRNPELADFLRRLNVTVTLQTNPAPIAPKTPGR